MITEAEARKRTIGIVLLENIYLGLKQKYDRVGYYDPQFNEEEEKGNLVILKDFVV